MFCIDFRDFPNNLLSLGLTLSVRKRFFSVFDFSGATGLEKGQGKRTRLGNFETIKMR
jgi:hypothetical protein